MDITVIARQMQLTDSMKSSVISKLERLEKYFTSDVPVKATVSKERNKSKIEVTIPMKGGAVIRAEASNYDFYSAIDEVVSKLGKQLRKHKTRLMSKGNETIRFENIEEIRPQNIEEEKIVRRKKFDFVPMTEDEAILQMELLDHNFFVFTNTSTGDVNVIYKRQDGNYGLIESRN